MPGTRHHLGTTNATDPSLAHSTGFQNRLVEDFWKGFISGVVHHPDDVDGVLVKSLLQAILKVINDAFDFAENIMAEAFDLLRDIVRHRRCRAYRVAPRSLRRFPLAP